MGQLEQHDFNVDVACDADSGRWVVTLQGPGGGFAMVPDGADTIAELLHRYARTARELDDTSPN